MQQDLKLSSKLRYSIYALSYEIVLWWTRVHLLLSWVEILKFKTCSIHSSGAFPPPVPHFTMVFPFSAFIGLTPTFLDSSSLFSFVNQGSCDDTCYTPQKKAIHLETDPTCSLTQDGMKGSYVLHLLHLWWYVSTCPTSRWFATNTTDPWRSAGDKKRLQGDTPLPLSSGWGHTVHTDQADTQQAGGAANPPLLHTQKRIVSITSSSGEKEGRNWKVWLSKIVMWKRRLFIATELRHQGRKILLWPNQEIFTF